MAFRHGQGAGRWGWRGAGFPIALLLAALVAVVLPQGASAASGTGIAPLPAAVSGPSGAVDVAVGRGHACALMATGHVWCWGRNDRGQLGYESDTDHSTQPRPVPGISTAVQIVAGDLHTCARLSDGTARCWGANGSGQLGNGSTTDSTNPVTPTGLTGATQIVAGRAHTCALAQSVYCWGANGFGQLGLGSVQEARLGLAELSQLYSSGGGSIDSDVTGNVVVSDAATNGTLGVGSVVKYGDDGTIKAFWRIPGTSLPGAVATAKDGSRTYVASLWPGETSAWVMSGATTIDGTWNVTANVPGCGVTSCQVRGLATAPDGTVYAAVQRFAGGIYSRAAFIATASAAGVASTAVQNVTNDVSEILDVTFATSPAGTGRLWILGATLAVLPGTNPKPTLTGYTVSPGGAQPLTKSKPITAYTPQVSCTPPESYFLLGPIGTGFRWFHQFPVLRSLRLGTAAGGQLALSADYLLGTRYIDSASALSAPADNGSNYTSLPDSDYPDCVMLIDPENSSATEASVQAVYRGNLEARTDLRRPIDATASESGGLVISDPSYAEAGPARLQRVNAVGDLVQWGRVSLRSTPARIIALDVIQASGSAPDFQNLLAGAHHTCVSGTIDGQASTACWGSSSAGQTGWPAAGSGALRFGLPPTDTGDQSSFPVVITGVAGPGDGGVAHTCMARSTDSRMVCWGSNSAGQSMVDAATEGAIVGPGFIFQPTATRIDAGALNTCLFNGGTGGNGLVLCYGSDAYGQSSRTPGTCQQAIFAVLKQTATGCEGVTGATAISSGSATTCAVLPESLSCWGDNTWGTLATDGSFEGPVAVPFVVPAGVSVSGPATLTGSIQVVLQATVDPSEAYDVVLRVQGTTVAVAATATLAGDDSRTLAVTPSAPLVAGQRYEILVNSTGSGTVTSGGVPVPGSITAFRAPTSLGETGPATTVTWAKRTTSSAVGGSYLSERTAGATVVYSFSGTSLGWVTRKGPAEGKARVTIDGVSKTVDLYKTTLTPKAVVTFGGLSSGTHKVQITALGTRNSASKGTSVAVDGFVVGGSTIATPALAQSWSRVASSSASDGSYIRSAQAGATYTLRFRGTGVVWRTFAGPTEGDARVSIDGVVRGTYSLYATSRSARSLSLSGLADGVHTVVITVLGTGQGATDQVSIDGWSVR